MIKTVIKACSCFIDKSVWFLNLSQKRAVNPWRFDCFEPERRIVDIISNKFIKDIRTTKILVDEKTCLKNTIVISCVDCFEFQLMLISLQENSMLDTLNCRFVTYDCSTFDDDYSSDIFTGNYQFVLENYFYLHEQRELLFRNSNVELAKQPLQKSCFTSLQKKTLSVFLHNLQKSL